MYLWKNIWLSLQWYVKRIPLGCSRITESLPLSVWHFTKGFVLPWFQANTKQVFIFTPLIFLSLRQHSSLICPAFPRIIYYSFWLESWLNQENWPWCNRIWNPFNYPERAEIWRILGWSPWPPKHSANLKQPRPPYLCESRPMSVGLPSRWIFCIKRWGAPERSKDLRTTMSQRIQSCVEAF